MNAEPSSGKIKALFCWSGGKDSALCLHEVRQAQEYEVAYLVTTLNENFKRVSIHGVREEMLELQAKETGVELLKVYVKEGSNAEYEKQMGLCFQKARDMGISHVIFGDIFLEDLRAYREKTLAGLGMKAVFPLWKRDTSQVIAQFLSLNFRTVICCVNDAWLGEEWPGREIGPSFIQDLPKGTDPCGENGEFHTFCFDGPVFKKPIPFQSGEKIYKALELKAGSICGPELKTKGFWYIDIIPVTSPE